MGSREEDLDYGRIKRMTGKRARDISEEDLLDTNFREYMLSRMFSTKARNPLTYIAINILKRVLSPCYNLAFESTRTSIIPQRKREQ